MKGSIAVLSRSRLVGLSLLAMLSFALSCSPVSVSYQPGDTKRLITTLRASTGCVRHVAYSPDGSEIASCHEEPAGTTNSQNSPILPTGPSERESDKKLRELNVWDLRGGKVRLTINRGTWTDHATYAADGKRIAGAMRDHTVRIWNADDGKQTRVLRGHNGLIRSLDVSGDGKLVVTGSADHRAKVWDASTGECLATLEAGHAEVESVSCSRDGKRVAWVTKGNFPNYDVRVWDVTNRKEVLRFSYDSYVGGIGFSPDADRLAAFSYGRTNLPRPGLVVVWDAPSGKLLLSRQAHSRETTCIAYSRDGKRIASGAEDGTVSVSNAVTGDEILKLLAHELPASETVATWLNTLTSIAFSPDGNRLARQHWMAPSRSGT